jgi:hypothetical protein
VDEVESEKWMVVVFDPTVHVNAARRADMAMDRCRRVEGLELDAVCGHRQAVARNHGDLRKKRPFGFPTSSATAQVIVGGLRVYADFDLLILAMTVKFPTREILVSGLETRVDSRVYRHAHGSLLS